MSRKLGRRAVVVGAGIGGLSAAGALAKYFDQVDILERDHTPLSVETRLGTPQDRHAHALLAGGLQALNDIYPNFDRDLAAAGAVAVNVPADVRYETPGFSERPQRDFGIAMLSASRPLIESVLRRRTLAAGNVALWSNCRVTEIQQRGSSAAAIVQTVQFNIGAESARTLKADLVIDATGRGALALGFLRTLGWEQPPETRIGVDISYATAVTPIPANLALGWKLALTLPDPPSQPLNAVLLPAEGDRWMVSIADRGTAGWIDDWNSFLDALGRLSSTTLRDALQHAQSPPAIHHYRFTASTWKHYERLPRLPRGIIPLGDAFCRFNPIYGQGMSAAAQQSRLLQTALANAANELDPLVAAQASVMSAVGSILQTPWTMAANSDYEFPQTQGTRPDNFAKARGSQEALFRAIASDAIVHRAFVEVSHLLQPYSLLRTPAIRERIEAAVAMR
jgi:2-polyprenyl-6-methoxyphenol hydroxylase-like FAD-dependent oxidoreductase